MSTATASPYLRDQSDHDRSYVDRLMSVAPQEVQDKVRRYPLTGDQAGALRVLVDQGNGDFLWSNPSTTQRLLEGLANKGLAIRGTTTDRYGRERGTYSPLPAMRDLFRADKQEREQAYRERRDAEQAERAAKVAAARARLDQDVAVLNAALDLLVAQGDVSAKDLDSARARVDRLADTSDYFLGG